jgi:hypothetical protein
VQLAGAGKRDTVAKQTDAKCLVMGESVVSNAGAGIRTIQLHRVIEKRDVGNP